MSPDYPRTRAAAAANAEYARMSRKTNLLILAIFGLVIASFVAIDATQYTPGAIATMTLLGFIIMLSIVVVTVVLLPLWAASHLSDSVCRGEIRSLPERLLARRLGVTQYQTLAAVRLFALQDRVTNLRLDGDDTVAQILTGRIVTIKQDVEAAISGLEGIDGQALTDFGNRFVWNIIQRTTALSNSADHLEDAVRDYLSASKFDTDEGRQIAFGMVRDQIVTK